MDNTQLIHIRMLETTITKLDKLSKDMFESRSTLIRRAVKEFLEKRS